MSTTRYEVHIEAFTERHFIKSFSKKYKSAWDSTLSFLIDEYTYMDVLFVKNIAETIIDTKTVKICKTEFKIAGTKESRHRSGNRGIVAVHKDTLTVHVLLVYHKNDLGGGNETSTWKNIIREHYSEYCDIV